SAPASAAKVSDLRARRNMLNGLLSGRRATIGASFGGLISAKLAFGYPEVFGHCGVHSGAYWPKGSEAVAFIEDHKDAPVNYAAIWGTYEGVTHNNYQVRDLLQEAEKEIYWRELPEGHTWALWRATMDELLAQFFPMDSLSPNPIPPSTE
ncbi:MAG: alpha/beta hydrolase-fold protein, partial [Bacteroidota bacterium]